MGFDATQVDEMSLWQLSAQSEGFSDAHTPKEKRRMGVEDFEEISSWLDEDWGTDDGSSDRP